MIKQYILSLFNNVGMEIVRLPKAASEMLWLKSLDIDKVVDIGANEGQFSYRMNKILPNAHFFAFEPIPQVFDKLKANLNGKIRHFHSFNIGFGDYTGGAVFELNEFTASSSFRNIKQIHKDNFPKTTKTKKIDVKIDRLDSYLGTVNPDRKTLIKIDVQGYEDKVLQGGLDFIRRSKILIIELSFIQLYEGSSLFNEIYQKLIATGFEFKGSLKNIYSTIDGSILQCDGIFIKT